MATRFTRKMEIECTKDCCSPQAAILYARVCNTNRVKHFTRAVILFPCFVSHAVGQMRVLNTLCFEYIPLGS